MNEDQFESLLATIRGLGAMEAHAAVLIKEGLLEVASAIEELAEAIKQR